VKQDTKDVIRFLSWMALALPIFFIGAVSALGPIYLKRWWSYAVISLYKLPSRVGRYRKR
jgi:hypothetical protein